MLLDERTTFEREVVGLVGESGSGKSSIAISILDLLEEGARIESGSIVFDGTDLRTLTHSQRARLRGRSIGTVFQDPFTSLNPALTVGFQISEPLIEHKGISASQASRLVLDLLAEVGIRKPAEMASAYPHQLSGGMLQRALIATALACEPKLLLLDEPTTALDVTVEAKVIELLAKLCRDHNLSALFVSHNLGIVSQICNRSYVLYACRPTFPRRLNEGCVHFQPHRAPPASSPAPTILVRPVKHVTQVGGRNHGHHCSVVAHKTHCHCLAVCKPNGHATVGLTCGDRG